MSVKTATVLTHGRPDQTAAALETLRRAAIEAGYVLRFDHEEVGKHDLAPADGLELEAPLSDDVDLEFLATQFKLSGGAIRNCSLAAAFQAADDDGAIEMRHLVRAVAQEYGKQGRLTLEADFERFHDVIKAGAGRR